MRTPALSALLSMTLAACGGGGSSVSAPPVAAVPPPTAGTPPAVTPPVVNPPISAGVVKSSIARIAAPQASDADVAAVVTGNSTLAGRALPLLASSPDANTVFSPYSLTLGLALPAAGAKGDTLKGMEQALSYVPQEKLQPALNKLDLLLAAQTRNGAADTRTVPELRIVNTVWGQSGYPILPAYLDTVAANYGAGLRTLDFRAATEEARKTINSTIETDTNGKIKDLLPQGTVTTDTRLVLTNAVWFKGQWVTRFLEGATQQKPFTSRNGSVKNVATMQQDANLSYAKTADYEAVELPYTDGKFAMTFVMPAAGKFDSYAAGFNAASIAAVTGGLKPQYMALALPKFTFSTEADAGAILKSLGMTAAFEPLNADFSGITGQRDLVITSVRHKAFIDVNEEGTEAAAATGVVVGVTSLPPTPTVKMQLDRPFLFLIRERATGLVLFAGKVVTL
ncbi:MAG TPA: serpin family protein [Burkholderiaceae bacterium]